MSSLYYCHGALFRELEFMISQANVNRLGTNNLKRTPLHKNMIHGHEERKGLPKHSAVAHKAPF